MFSTPNHTTDRQAFKLSPTQTFSNFWISEEISLDYELWNILWNTLGLRDISRYNQEILNKISLIMSNNN